MELYTGLRVSIVLVYDYDIISINYRTILSSYYHGAFSRLSSTSTRNISLSATLRRQPDYILHVARI